jgi:uncharacterized membrane protein HdeD (DUF308 family)
MSRLGSRGNIHPLALSWRFALDTKVSAMSEINVQDQRIQIRQAIAGLWWLVLLRGVLAVLLGLYAVFQPGMTLVVFTQVLGAFVLMDGIFAVMAGVLGWTDSRMWTIVRGALGILIGLFVFAHPVLVGTIAAMTIVIIVGIQTIASGILEIYVAIRARKEVEGEGWLIFGGTLAVIFGGILLMAPLMSSIVFIRVLGAFAVFFGITVIMTALRMRKLV